MSTYVHGYGCVTAAGQGPSPFFGGLAEGVDHSRPAETHGWPKVPGQAARTCLLLGSRQGTHEERMAFELADAYEQACRGLRPDAVIFASTKGAIEDLVWDPRPDAMRHDTLQPVLARFLAVTGLEPRRALCLSNACSSVHAALRHASLWLEAGVARDVLVLAADHVGPFVVNGFASLKSLAADKVTPFAPGRQGIQLGEVAAAIHLSRASHGARLRLGPVPLLTEGHALTRSREDGATLRRVVNEALLGRVPDVVVAHGTGTEANDAMEDRVYKDLAGRPPVTCTKWSIGHGLGASGAADFVAAAEMLARDTVFAIGNTEAADPAFGGRYLVRGSTRRHELRRALLCSVGFGGMHAAAVLEKP